MARGKLAVHPDFEITIRRGGGKEILVVALFIEEDGTVDFGVGWDGETEIGGLRTLLLATELALQNVGNWSNVEDLHVENEKAKIQGDELPF